MKALCHESIIVASERPPPQMTSTKPQTKQDILTERIHTHQGCSHYHNLRHPPCNHLLFHPHYPDCQLILDNNDNQESHMHPFHLLGARAFPPSRCTGSQHQSWVKSSFKALPSGTSGVKTSAYLFVPVSGQLPKRVIITRKEVRRGSVSDVRGKRGVKMVGNV